jgi:hypothetical protein
MIMTSFIKEEELGRRRSKTKPSLVVPVGIAVVSVGYIMALAILAPQQLAEATAAATDLACSGCVGTSDIANSAVTSAKIGSGQVGNSDIANSAVATGKISDTNGVYSVDIVNGQVGSVDIGDGQVATADIASGAIKLEVHTVTTTVNIPPDQDGKVEAICPTGEIVTGGGFGVTGPGVYVQESAPLSGVAWRILADNQNPDNTIGVRAYALCADPTEP